MSQTPPIQQPDHERANQGLRLAGLVASLAATWLLLSGHFEPLLLVLGAVSVGVVLFVAKRMDVIDHEGVPVELRWRILSYWPWLAREIFKASIDVAKRTLDPRLPIHPVVLNARASQRTDLGQVLYANSITLTPGTTSMDLDPGVILVHALSQEGADDIRSGVMDARVTRTEGAA